MKAVSVKGSYLLVLHLGVDLRQLPIGSLGCFDFPAGYYLYVGSAFGSGGLPARLAYHQRRVKPHPHWHLDYLRPHTHLLEAWTVSGAPRLECRWCQILYDHPRLQIPAPGFGSRDTGCPSHLFYTPTRPRVAMLTSMLLGSLALAPGDLAEVLVEIHIFDD